MSGRSYFRRRQVAFGVVEFYSNKCRARFERFAYHQRQTRSFVSVTYLMACKQARGRGQPKWQPRLLNVAKEHDLQLNRQISNLNLVVSVAWRLMHSV